MPTRRSKGDGSVTHMANGKWRARIETTPVDGKRQWLSAVAETKTAAVAKLKELQRQKEDNLLRLSAQKDSISFQKDVYLKHLEALGRKQSTIKHAGKYIRLFDEFINGMSLSRITSKQLDDYILYKRNVLHNKESSVSAAISPLKGFFTWCVNTKLIKDNPTVYYKTKSSKRSTMHFDVISNEEHQKIKDYLRPMFDRYIEGKYVRRVSFKFRFYAIYCLAYETGMRIGEIVVLKWDDFDFEEGFVTVDETESAGMDTSTVVDIPKTSASYRRIKISDKTLQLFKDIYTITGSISPWVCYSYKSKYRMLSDGIRTVFKLTLKAAGIDRELRFHDIRHTNASNMIANNVPIPVITKRLGHTNIEITYSTYAHLVEKYREVHEAVIEA